MIGDSCAAVLLAVSLLLGSSYASAADELYLHCEFSGETVSRRADPALWSDRVDFKIDRDAQRVSMKGDGTTGWRRARLSGGESGADKSGIVIAATEAGWRWRYEIPTADIGDGFGEATGLDATADALKQQATDADLTVRPGAGTCALARPCRIGSSAAACIVNGALPPPGK